VNVVKLIGRELFGMFVDDEFLALAVLAVVAVAAIAAWISSTPVLTGVILLVGCVGVLVASVLQASRKSRL
jgi:hypothetical protein